MFNYKYVAHSRMAEHEPVTRDAIRLWSAMRAAAKARNNSLERIIDVEYHGDRQEVTAQLSWLIAAGWVSVVEGDNWRKNPVRPLKRGGKKKKEAKQVYRGDCIPAKGVLSRQGYGRIFIDGKARYAHRVEWEKVHGPIPAGASVLHRCGNPSCINVDHLYLGQKNGKPWEDQS